MFKKIFNIRNREERVQDAIDNAIRNIHCTEHEFTLEEQTDIVQGIQQRQFEILERKLSELETVKDQLDRITILSVND